MHTFLMVLPYIGAYLGGVVIGVCIGWLVEVNIDDSPHTR